MRLAAAAIAMVLAVPATLYAAEGAPSEQVLANMGLAGMQILSDDQAAVVRGSGFQPSDLNGFEHYQESIDNFHQRVDDFHDRVAGFQDRIDRHISKAKSKIHKTKKQVHKHAKKFRHHAKKFGQKHHGKPGHGGMKPSKHGHELKRVA